MDTRMIPDQEVTHKGIVYVWSHKPDLPVDSAWTWRNKREFTTPSEQIQRELNHIFRSKNTPQITNTIADPQAKKRFIQINAAMGRNGTSPSKAISHTKSSVESAESNHSPNQLDEVNHKQSTSPEQHCTPFNCAVLRMWYFADTYDSFLNGREAILHGEGPFSQLELTNFLRQMDVGTAEINSRSGLLILGRESLNTQTINKIIDSHKGNDLSIYSQEMLLSAIGCGKDPLADSEAVIEAFRHGHPGLQYVSQGWPGWVQRRHRSEAEFAIMESSIEYSVEESPLHRLGYKVGRSGKSERERHRILTQAFENALPNAGTAEYMGEWGEPKTRERLRKMARHLAALADNNSRRSIMQQAVKDWNDDLAWLKETFYRGHMQFDWPQTSVG